MIDKAFNKLALGFALFFMVCELTYVNAKSLLYMVASFDDIDKFFAVIGSLAFSMVTVVVMRKTTKQWVKVVFPVFDTLLVFCGFNLHYADAILEGSDNPVRFWLSVFMSLFTGFITYSLGMINYETRESESKVTSTDEQTKINLLGKQIDSLNSDIEQMGSEIAEKASVIEERERTVKLLEGEIRERETKIKGLEGKLKLTEGDLRKYRAAYVVAERSRILKKLESNRTPAELEILKEAEMLQMV